jgi:hypothetical protein
MHRYLCFVGACVVGALSVMGCNGEVGSASTSKEPPAAAPPKGGSSGSGGAASTGSGSGGGSGGEDSDSGSATPIPIPEGPSISIAVASSFAALQAGQFATTFDVLRTDDLLVVATVGSTYEGQSLGLNFQSPSGGPLAGYTAVVTGGVARFDVKLGGTVVGNNAQTGAFPLVLGQLGTQKSTQKALARTTITLVKAVSQ